MDTSASMAPLQKQNQLNNIIYYLINYLHIKKEPFAFTYLNEKEQMTYPSSSTSHHFTKVLNTLNNITYSSKNPSYKQLFSLINTSPKNSDIFYFSDFQNDIKPLESVVTLASKKQTFLYFICLFNTNLLNLSVEKSGNWIIDKETGQKSFIEKRMKENYQQIVIKHYKALEIFCKKKRIRYYKIDSNMNHLNGFLSLFN